MNFSDLVCSISQLHEELTQQAAKAVNRSLTVRNWLIGYYIKEFEQSGSDRASYGDHILQDLASQLPRQDGFSYCTLKLYRQFYMTNPKMRQTVSAQCVMLGIWQTLSAKFTFLPFTVLLYWKRFFEILIKILIEFVKNKLNLGVCIGHRII